MNISVRVTLNQTIVSIKQFGVFVAHPLDSDSVHYFLVIHNWIELVLENHSFLTNTKWFWNRFRYVQKVPALGGYCISGTTDLVTKGSFFSESAMCLSNLQNKYYKSLSWTWNLNFPPITVKNLFKFQAQDRIWNIYFGNLKNTSHFLKKSDL